MLGFASLFTRRPKTAPAVETRSTLVTDLAAPSEMLLDLFGAQPLQSGVNITPENSMRVPAVRAAVEAIAEAVGCLPCLVYERDASGAVIEAKDHPAYPLLRDAANPWTPSSRLIEQITRDALTFGNGFAFINRRDGAPAELIHIRPINVQVQYVLETQEPVYRITNGDDQREVHYRDMIHIQAPSIDGVAGASPVIMCGESIGVLVAMQGYAARLFGKGGRPAGILKFPNKLGAEVAKRIKASWQSSQSGQSSGDTAVIEEGGDFKPLAFSSVDNQYIELWQHHINEVARVFRVPPSLIYEMGRATWGNATEMGASFLKFSLVRWLKAWEGELNLKLITPEDRARFYAEFNTDELLRADLPTRATAYATMINSRVFNPNEVRALENRAPYAGGELFINPNTTVDGGADIDAAYPDKDGDADA
jgi:HK97 family phage portal protein